MEYQGGDSQYLDDPEKLPVATPTKKRTAPERGAVDTREADYDAQDKDWTLRQAKLSRLVPGTVVQVKNGDYRLAMPETHAGKAQQLSPPNRLVDPFFFRSWAQWFVANELPYAEAEYHVRPVQALLRLQRPKQGFRFYISDNGLVGFGDLIADLSFDRL